MPDIPKTVPGIPFREANNIGGLIVPEIVVIHDTASRIEKGNAARYLRNNSAPVSVHFVIERDGSVEQQVPLYNEAWHAGRSHYHGRDGVNEFSIGIELVNPGRMTDAGSDAARTWFGEPVLKSGPPHERAIFAETHEHGSGWWMGYPQAQLDALIDLLERLFVMIPGLHDIRGHWYISPGRKVDPNPLFPMEQIRTRILGRDRADAEPEVDEGKNVWLFEEDYDEPMVQIELGQIMRDDKLNMRRWPSFNPNVIAQIPDGAVVPVTRQGLFDGRSWLRVTYAGQEGWIVARYTAPIRVEEVS
ncbi:N-acetylmuramoyl-L-alanine amidase [Tropicimonas sp. S265A]|uniref:N-acetylmuramoyl-L-alanine amidase n=1 Tax=Tropicimonas sp. S265A TaxID=3415134 RepID=UPI003C7B46EC